MEQSLEFITSVEELKKYIHITAEEETELNKIIEDYPMSITKYYLSLIDKNDEKDPIKRMAIPTQFEKYAVGDVDTSGEYENTKLKGLQHKYGKTALLLSTNNCAMYCRYCFRKRMVGLDSKEIIENLKEAISYIKEHKEINNVLITGGDSFFLSTDVIEKFIIELNDVKHVKVIRFGTRIPVVWPDRIINDEKLQKILKENSRADRKIYVVTQFNHPKELTEKAVNAIRILQNCNVLIKNQSVLLNGVNADSTILAELMNNLVSVGVIPYYVFQCRPVKGVKGHFQLTLNEGERIIRETRKSLNGLSKKFRYIMSHKTGKIEIVGVMENKMIFRYHQSKENEGMVFYKQLSEHAGWLDDYS